MSDEAASGSARKLGQQLVLALASAIRTAAYYDGSNRVMQQVGASLGELLAERSPETGSVAVAVRSHSVYVDRVRIPGSVAAYERFAFLIQLFETWGIGELTFDAGLSGEELMRALMVISRARPPEGEANLADLLRAAGIERVSVRQATEQDGRGGGKGGGKGPGPSPLVSYSAAAQLSAELAEAAGPIEPGVVRRARRVTQAVVDEILADPWSVLALTTIKDRDRDLFLHSTNVAVLSTILGQRLGLSKARLGELCLAGFLHDAGKLWIDPDVLQKPGALTDEEWKEVRRHPILAARALLGERRLSASTMRAVVVAFEHHLNHDLSGYPTTEIKKSLSLFGSIVSIVDRFDALTTSRAYRKVNLTPPEVIVELVRRSGTHFDPILVKLFVEVVGLYPPGSVVVLTGGEAGVVSAPPAIGSPPDRPSVRVIVGGEPGTVRDLTEQVGGKYARSVLGVLNPSNKGQLPAVDASMLRPLG